MRPGWRDGLRGKRAGGLAAAHEAARPSRVAAGEKRKKKKKGGAAAGIRNRAANASAWPVSQRSGEEVGERERASRDLYLPEER